ncbi:non-hydrolyzing UDP-N-acetylglucosamine 2-epimerase [Mangrovihabitans endophyticus]|uniref:UDP-N-acetyl glucosamine 2-epimerase n=1 Tax=Mangrovihabitans endophyticus TaxID=1751298 RepID=A0A8J3FQ51_9ACTN|nr:UDP-N-acetylglucosamine 2-epimerase (non-hydrolyzing) [Mangrovihabitans endophyticus]GGL06975.1 UDP-N-acetyl glucosamine 2-epimerase [Mangrovihabitans endophyticus]
MTATPAPPSLNGKIAVVFGTRPEIIKLAPVMASLGEDGVPVFTGQHYDPELTRAVLLSCGLPDLPPSVTGLRGQPRGVQIAEMLRQLHERFAVDRPACVIVQGDTNSTNAGAQAAHYLGIPVVHVEAGLRSGDRTMPEEINRMLVSSVADVHCAATSANVDNLLRSGITEDRIHLTGNPIVEAVRNLLPTGRGRAACGPRNRPYVLATIHRPENTDNRSRLAQIIDQLDRLGRTVLFPAHPRTAQALRAAGIESSGTAIHLISPLDYRSFLGMAHHADVIISDSGGIQEEVTVLRRPLVVVRTSTERPEAVAAGFAVLCEPGDIVRAAAAMATPAIRAKINNTASPYGDGLAGTRIAALARSAVHV